MDSNQPINIAKWNEVLASIGESPGIVTVEPIGIGEGMLGRIFRIATDDATYVLKIVADSGSNVERFKPGEREAMTYAWLQKQQARLGVTVPRFFHWELECNGLQCLLLEDLSARGAKVRDPLVGLQHHEIHAALASIAEIHSAGSMMSTPGLADLPTEGFLLTGKSPILLEIITEALVNIACLLPDHYAYKRANELAIILQEISVQTVLAKAHTQSCMVGLCHGDLWSNNILFTHPTGAANATATIIDWQFSTWGNPLVDPAFLIISSMSPERRRAEERELLAAYYNKLDDDLTIGTGYTFDACFADYDSAGPYGALMTLANFESYLAYPDRSNLVRLLDRFEAVAMEFFGRS